jgi:hypothetical protein
MRRVKVIGEWNLNMEIDVGGPLRKCYPVQRVATRRATTDKEQIPTRAQQSAIRRSDLG